jgi:hypothetical protein
MKSFTFISNSLILISAVYAGECRLGIVEVKESQQSGGCDELFQAIFLLPPLMPLSSCENCALHATGNTSHRPSPDCDTPFYHSDDSRILSVYMDFGSNCSYRLAIHAASLLRVFQEAISGQNEDRKFTTKVLMPILLPWSSLSPHARLLAVDFPWDFLGEASHTRLLLPLRLPNILWLVRYMPVLYDFSSAIALRRDLQLYAPADSYADYPAPEYHLDPEVVEDQRVWQGRVESSLPYRKITLDQALYITCPSSISGDAVIVQPLEAESERRSDFIQHVHLQRY